MNVYFRELTIEDIPAINDISKDIWEGEDYIPHVIQGWLQDENCMNYGTFTDETKTNLIGFGRVKLYNKDIAWLEGGRIKVSYQGKGIGKLQLYYAIEYARKIGAKVAQYDTSSNNFASISLAKYYGFKRKKYMELIEFSSQNINLTKRKISTFEKMSAKEAKKYYTEFDIGPGTEICIGWSYIPLNFITDTHGSWKYNEDSILLKIEHIISHGSEVPLKNEIWLISYGNAKAALDLILDTIQEEVQLNAVFQVFCSPEIADLLKRMGFKPYNDPRVCVILFEKSLA
ncbi:MAG: GNAT family N-acetyltransferase [Candidatus Thorarchaeota archaeon]